jgi:dephospho-CoA kinase
MTVVGLTGNYGSGKSTVARMFKELGAPTIDTDVIVRELLDDPAVISEIGQRFGAEASDGNTLNKKWLADRVFRDPYLRIDLEDIIHPKVFDRIVRETSKLDAAGEVVVIVEAAVIFERGHQSKFDKIITVYVTKKTGMQRLLDKGVTEADATRRLESQLPVEIKIRGSDFVIDNSGDIENTREQARSVYQDLLSGEKKHANN